MLALLNGNSRMIRPGWIFAPRTFVYLSTVRDTNGNFAFRQEMLGGSLWSYPFGFTTSVPQNLGGGANESEVYLADFADVVVGESPMIELASSDSAAYHDGSAVVAAFSRDQTVVRAVMEHDLVMRHAESVAMLTAVLWA
jgi:HK97 family phage major capsid protein